MSHEKEIEEHQIREDDHHSRPTGQPSRPTRDADVKTEDEKDQGRPTDLFSRPTEIPIVVKKEQEDESVEDQTKKDESTTEELAGELTVEDKSKEEEADTPTSKETTQHLAKDEEKEEKERGTTSTIAGPSQTLCTKSIEGRMINSDMRRMTRSICTLANDSARVDRPLRSRPTRRQTPYSTNFDFQNGVQRTRPNQEDDVCLISNDGSSGGSSYKGRINDQKLLRSSSKGEKPNTQMDAIQAMFERKPYENEAMSALHHLREVEETMRRATKDEESFNKHCLRLFKHSLCGEALLWHERLNPEDIKTWEDLRNKFIDKFLS